MKSETRIAYAEIEEILRNMPQTYVDKIPKKLKEFFYQEKDEKHCFKYDNSKKLANQNMNKKTRTLLAILKLNYWCVSEEERKIWEDKFIKNEENHQKYLSEKYNTYNLFKKQEYKIEEKLMIEKKQSTMIEYKETIFQKFINKIKSVFHRTNREAVTLAYF